MLAMVELGKSKVHNCVVEAKFVETLIDEESAIKSATITFWFTEIKKGGDCE